MSSAPNTKVVNAALFSSLFQPFCSIALSIHSDADARCMHHLEERFLIVAARMSTRESSVRVWAAITLLRSETVMQTHTSIAHSVAGKIGTLFPAFICSLVA
jgi:hypothetical protein